MPLSISRSTNRSAADELSYDLPDSVLTEDPRSGIRRLVWIPDRICVVLGQSNNLGSSLDVTAVEKDRVPVYRRPSGGEAVVLTERMIVISVREDEDQLRSPQQVFNNHNGKIITALKGLGITRLSLKGISDIALEEKKILGSSLYRARGMVFFHAVLNVSQQPYIFERYLRHPPREPEYRRGRTHREFVTSLYAEGHELPMDRLKAAIEAALDSIPSL